MRCIPLAHLLPPHPGRGTYCYLQRSGSMPHLIALPVRRGADEATIRQRLQALIDNPALVGLAPGRDYRWEGLSRLAFRDAADAMLCWTHLGGATSA